MRVRTALEKAVKDSVGVAEHSLDELLKWYVMESDSNHRTVSRRESALLLLTLLLYDIPPPGVMKLKPCSEFTACSQELIHDFGKEGVCMTVGMRTTV